QETATGIEKVHFRHEQAGAMIGNLSACYEQLRQYKAAEAWQRKWLAVVQERQGTQSSAYADRLVDLGLNLLCQHKHPEAEAVLRDCLAIRTKQQPTSGTPQRAIHAGRCHAGAAQVRRCGTAAAEWLPGNEKARGEDSGECKFPPDGGRR